MKFLNFKNTLINPTTVHKICKEGEYIIVYYIDKEIEEDRFYYINSSLLDAEFSAAID